METANHQVASLQTQRTIPYTPDAVYAAFSDPDRLARWWGPDDFTNTFEIFEFRTGGNWKYLMHGPDGHDYPNKCVFRDLVAGERLVIEHVSALRFTLPVSLLPAGNRTRVLWVQEFEDPQVAEAVRHIAGPANQQNLVRLEMHLRAELS